MIYNTRSSGHTLESRPKICPHHHVFAYAYTGANFFIQHFWPSKKSPFSQELQSHKRTKIPGTNRVKQGRMSAFLRFLVPTYTYSSDSPEGCDGLGAGFLTLWEWIIRALSPGPGTSITVWGIKRVMEHRNSIRPMRKLTNSPNPSEISKVSRFLSSAQQQCT